MPFDSGMMSAVAHELANTLIGARVDKIHVPARDVVILQLYTSEGTRRLELNASSQSPSIHFTTEPIAAPPTPSQFCLMLRKHLTSARLRHVEQLGLERVIALHFDTRDEMGFEQKRMLVFELIGKFSNVILCDQAYKILAVMRPVDFSTSALRQLLVGMTYEAPPKQDKRDPLHESAELFAATVQTVGSDTLCEKFLIRNYSGFSPLIAREIAFVSGGAIDCTLAECSDKLWRTFSEVIGNIKAGKFTPTFLSGEGVSDICFMDIHQYGTRVERQHFDSASDLLLYAQTQKNQHNAAASNTVDIQSIITRTQAKILRKLSAIEADLLATEEAEILKLHGELLTSNLYRIKHGDRSVEVENYYTEPPEMVTIVLDAQLYPQQNAQAYYKKYAKLRNAKVELVKQRDKAQVELEYLATVQHGLEQVNTFAQADEIRNELAAVGYGFKTRKKAEKSRPFKVEATKYTTSGGFAVYCGRNNIQNDYVTHKLANKMDYWFHVQKAPGSHVVMICAGQQPSETDFFEAATIAAVNSSLKGSSNVPVDYTLIKNIKKPPGGAPGYVTYSTHKTAHVTPDVELVEKMKSGK